MLEQSQLVCETCGWTVADPIDHAFETGHRAFKFYGMVKEDFEKEEETDG